MNIKLPAQASDLQLRFWRWMANLTEMAMDHGPVVQRVLYGGVLVLAGFLAFTFGRIAGELIASLLL
jgi:glycine/D-amino acid oxidase-like deaminating enzyme